MKADYCERRPLSGTVELLILVMLWNDCTTYLAKNTDPPRYSSIIINSLSYYS